MAKSSPFAKLQWRAVGPRFCGGRIESIAVHESAPYTWFVAPGSGNLWKTSNAGMTWQPVFEHESTYSIGHVEIAPSDPEVIWVGTGEAHLSGTSYPGTGVFRSADSGQTWKNVGLHEVSHIGKVRVHPKDANTAWVAGIGPSGGRSPHRGIYRTTDGGKNWKQVLHASPSVAFIDLVVAPDDPDQLFAAGWDRGRRGDSGVWRSQDGGENWTKLTDGLPQDPQIERVAVAVSQSNPNVVYALTVDGRKPGDGRYGVGGVVYRSNDRGDTWVRQNESYLLNYVGWDFCDLMVAPDDPDNLFVCGMRLTISSDAGKTWRRAGETIQRMLPHRGEALHLDMHDLWIDPARGDHLLLGTDGGIFRSFDRGQSWLHVNTLPIAEFYTVTVDDAEPYNIWGGTQDNASVFGPATVIDQLKPDRWDHVFLDQWAGGDGFATLLDPTDDDVVYFEHQNGDMRRKQRSGSIYSGRADKRIRPRGRGLRFAWSTPILVSHHDPKRLYTAAQFVFRSEDRGDRWKKISGDLGKGRELLTLSESTLDEKLVYAGSSNGTVWATDSAGEAWRESRPVRRGLRDVVASRHSADVAFSVHRGTGGTPFAHVFRSTDRGKTWESIAKGLPAEPCNVIVEDPRSKDVLYVGTDYGVYVTTDGAATWHSLSQTLPTTPVVDLAIQARELELVAATHGRGIFVVDIEPIVTGR